jgi:hypothetical protein
MKTNVKRKTMMIAASFLTTVLGWVLVNRFLISISLWKWLVITVGMTALNMPLEYMMKKYFPEVKEEE